jgi:ribonuclease III
LAQRESGLQPERERELRGLARKLGQRFKDLALLDQALRHSSYAHENPASGDSNERLEFLGDAVLSLTVSKLLLEAFPHSPEGDLSRARAALVNARQLAALAGELELGAHLLLGRGEEQQAGRGKPSLLADALEAVLGACFLDGGLKVVEALTQRWFGPLLAARAGLPWQDFKTGLQEHTHARYNASPTYHLVQESGPGHARHFVVEVRLQDRPLARGEGKSKKLAAQEAARRALELLPGEEA